MQFVWIGLTLLGSTVWLVILLAPWRPWSTRERLVVAPSVTPDLRDTTVLIPARDEAGVIDATLESLLIQGSGLKVVVIDDASRDATGDVVRARRDGDISLLSADALPAGWTGKLWALRRGLSTVRTPYTLLLDADIVLAAGTVAAMRRRMRDSGAEMVSLMAWLRMDTFWERLLLPAFVFFFKLLYPFALSNAGHRRVCAAAGGCILVRTDALRRVDGFDTICGELIDDCALARRFRRAGFTTWTGLSDAARCSRRHTGLKEIWDMVARTAFTQLRYSPALLGLSSLVLIAVCWAPVTGWIAGPPYAWWSATAAACMGICYLPIIRYYGLAPGLALTLPISGTLFLAMTWNSAWRYWRGQRSYWKSRVYQTQGRESRAAVCAPQDQS